MIATESI